MFGSQHATKKGRVLILRYLYHYITLIIPSYFSPQAFIIMEQMSNNIA